MNNNYHEQMAKQYKARFNYELIENTIDNFNKLQNDFSINFATEDSEELDRLTIELLKVVELKRIAAMLEGMN